MRILIFSQPSTNNPQPFRLRQKILPFPEPDRYNCLPPREEMKETLIRYPF